MLGCILLVPSAEDRTETSLRFLSLLTGKKLWLGLQLAPDPGRQTRRCARRVGGAGARAPRPRGSHLGKSGWRPGRCAGPSSHWGGCWPSPAGSSAWFGRPPQSKRSAPRQPHQRGASCRLRGRSPGACERPRRGHRTPTGWTLPSGQGPDPPCPRRAGRARGQPGAGGGRWSPPRVPAPARNGSAAAAGRTARLRSWEASPARLLAGARTVPVTRPASAPGPRAHQRRPRFHCSPARSAQGKLGAKAGGGGNPASETRVCQRETASAAGARGGEGRAAKRTLRPEPLAPTPLASAHLPPRPPSVPRRSETLRRSNSREGPLSLLQSSLGSPASGGEGLHPAHSVPCHIPSSNL